MRKKEFKFGGTSGSIFQLGIVVSDIKVAMNYCVANLNIGPFTFREGFRAPAGNYRGRTDNPTLSIAHVFNGRFFLELIQQHENNIPSVYTEHVQKYGYGLHHFAISIAPEDYDIILKEYYQKGYEDVFTDQLPSGARIRYIAPKDEASRAEMVSSTGVGYFECVEVVPGEEEFFTRMRQVAENWDGKTIIGSI